MAASVMRTHYSRISRIDFRNSFETELYDNQTRIFREVFLFFFYRRHFVIRPDKRQKVNGVMFACVPTPTGAPSRRISSCVKFFPRVPFYKQQQCGRQEVFFNPPSIRLQKTEKKQQHPLRIRPLAMTGTPGQVGHERINTKAKIKQVRFYDSFSCKVHYRYFRQG